VTISRVAIREYLDRDLDSFNWMKKLRKSELEAELRQFKVPPVFKTEPWTHQLVCFYIGLCRPEFLFLLDMGLGKSKILADLITQRQRERKLQRALITVPNTINMASWRDDLAKHSDLEPWTCDIPDIEEKWARLSQPKGDVTVIDYQGLQWALCRKVQGKKKARLEIDPERVRIAQSLYNFLGVDESHKLKNHQNLWFAFMRDLCHAADYTYATTGTIFGKSPEEMWAQFYLVDRGETFGENLGIFRESFFGQHSDNFAGTVWTFNKRMSRPLHRMMQHRSVRYDEDEVPEIDLPKKTNVTIDLEMAGEQKEHYLRALEGLINAQGTPELLEAPWTRMRQILSGYLVWEDAAGRHKVVFKDNPKLAAVERMVSETGDSKLVICHYYTDTGDLLEETINKLGAGKVLRLYGGTKDKQSVRKQFMEDPSQRILVMNFDTGGTGNDGLQSVARYMAYYESPTRPDTRKQVDKRLHRPGQTKRTFFYDLVFKRTIEAGIMQGLREGYDLFDRVVNGDKLRRGQFTG
jgi:SNF2 family DNA or RNA helicase